jgi:hypothetical protein
VNRKQAVTKFRIEPSRQREVSHIVTSHIQICKYSRSWQWFQAHCCYLTVRDRLAGSPSGHSENVDVLVSLVIHPTILLRTFCGAGTVLGAGDTVGATQVQSPPLMALYPSGEKQEIEYANDWHSPVCFSVLLKGCKWEQWDLAWCSCLCGACWTQQCGPAHVMYNEMVPTIIEVRGDALPRVSRAATVSSLMSAHLLWLGSLATWVLSFSLLPQKDWFYLFCISFIHMCMQCLGHFSPFPPALSPSPAPSLSPPTPSIPGRNYFALISNFVEETVWAIIGRTKGFC